MPELCAYCSREADGPMLVQGNNMAHAECVIRCLNELLDPDWESGKELLKIYVKLAEDQANLPEPDLDAHTAIEPVAKLFPPFASKLGGD